MSTERELEKIAFRGTLYEEALKPFRADEGTPYPTSQGELDFHGTSRFRTRNRGHFLTSIQGTSAIVRHNNERRPVPPDEQAAIDRLQNLIQEVEKGLKWGPDLAIKCFADLDLLFTGGRLRGNTCVNWSTCETNQELRTTGGFLFCRSHQLTLMGITDLPRLFERGQIRVVLNAATIFHAKEHCPERAMFLVLLHEMCHAYGKVVSPRGTIGAFFAADRHDDLFGSRIHAVHRRSVRILGLDAIQPGEHYDTYAGPLLCGED